MRKSYWIMLLIVAGLTIPRPLFAQERIYYNDGGSDGRDTASCGDFGAPCKTNGHAYLRACQVSDADPQKSRIYTYHVLGAKRGSCRASGSGYEDAKLGADYDVSIFWNYLLHAARPWFFLGIVLGIALGWLWWRLKLAALTGNASFR